MRPLNTLTQIITTNKMQDYKLLYCRMDEDVRKALWQWIIDHSTINAKASKYQISFLVEDEDDMWRRVYYRYTGQYERYNQEERSAKKLIAANAHMSRIAEKMGRTTSEIEKGHNLYHKLVLYFYRKTRNKLKQINKEREKKQIKLCNSNNTKKYRDGDRKV